MNRRIWLLVAAFAALALAMGSGGFSAAQMDRGVSVAVSDHANAYVGLADPGARGTHPDDVPWVHDPSLLSQRTPVTPNDSETRLFVVGNRFDGIAFGLTVTATRDSPVVLSGADGVDRLDPGGVAVVTGTVDCGDAVGHHPLDLSLYVHGVGDGFSAEIDYEVSVHCAGGPPKKGPPPGADGPKNDE